MHNSKLPAAPLLAAALDYHARGWSPIPIPPRSKKASVKWQRYQSERASKAQLAKWFGNGAARNIAVIFGAASSGLVDREWDDRDAYHKWANRSPDLAGTLPTFESARGRHVLAIAAPGSVAAIRERVGKRDGKGAIGLGDGELRCGSGCYSVLPPSVHPSGHIYRWIVPLGESLPVIDVSVFLPADLKLPSLQSSTERDREGQSVPSEQRGTESHPPSHQYPSVDSAYSVGRATENSDRESRP